MEKKIFYHGTTYSNYLHILEGVDVNINRCPGSELDFGYGFYLTDAFWYAERIARQNADNLKEIGKYDPKNDRPVVIKVEVDMDQIRSADGLILRKKDKDFLSTVFMARLAKAGRDTIHKDYVYGPIAGGACDRVVGLYEKKHTAIRKWWCKFNFMLPFGSWNAKQLVIKNQSLVGALKTVSVKRIY